MSLQPTQEEFEAAAAAAIKPYYDPKRDGPLLTCIRPTSMWVSKDTWKVWPEYGATFIDWPTRGNGTNYGQFCADPSEAIDALVNVAHYHWLERQPEPEAAE